MPYDRWTDCPPRAPMGAADAVHGSYDHLILLLGRIAEFTVRDRTRKLQVNEAEEVQSQAQGSMQPSRAPQMPFAEAGHPTSSPGIGVPSSRPTPGSYGNTSLPSRARMPGSQNVGVPNRTSSSAGGNASADVDEAAAQARGEWRRITDALRTFHSLLGDGFQPINISQYPPTDSPFGAPLSYRSYDIACVWLYYNMAWILAHRAHPDMPPYAQQAAGAAAAQTRVFANEIGRITTGFTASPTNEDLQRNLNSAYCESCVPLFFAGIQYQDSAQRAWTVARLFDIESRCGFATAGIIANGCQTAWHKAYKAGHGPPYERVYNTGATDDRINGSWLRLDPREGPKEEDVTDRRFLRTKAATRLHWAVGVIGE